MIQGIDFAFGNGITPAQVRAAGYEFVCRYLTGLDGNPKDITAPELGGYLAASLPVVFVFERDGQEFSHNQGITDATAAQAQLGSLAAALNRPGVRNATVFFAQDLPESAHVDPVAYMRGVNSVIGVKRSGIYGRFATVKACFDAGVATYGWQTPGGSAGAWDSRALLRQVRYDVKAGPATADVDQAAYWASATPVLTARDDFGQFPAPPPPSHGPYRHVANGESLDQIAARRHTTALHLLGTSLGAYTPEDITALLAAPLAGVPFYTTNP